jgi:hypothetical protein
VLSAWFDNFFADQPATAEDERIIRDAVNRIPAAKAGSQAAERLLQRASFVLRDKARAAEFFGLADALDDRALTPSWPAEKIRILAARNSLWTYLAPAELPDKSWMTDPSWNDGAWQRGAAGFGAPVNLPSSGIVRAQGFNLRTPVLFRRTMEVSEPSVFAKIKLRLRANDGAVVWINGTEVVRRNVNDESDISRISVTAASGSQRPSVSLHDPDILKPGRNLVAVAVFAAPARTALNQFIFDLVIEGLEK